MKLITLILSIMLLLTSCGVDETPNSNSQSNSFGSWAFEIGGSLKGKTADDLTEGQIESASFYYIKKYIAFGIYHEYIGLVVRNDQNTESLYTSGLIAEDDYDYFSAVYRSRPSKSIKKIRTFTSLSKLEMTLSSIEEYMEKSLYNNRGIYTVSMITTPLTGRPCAKTAQKIKSIIIK